MSDAAASADGSSEKLFEGIGVGIKCNYKMRLPLYKSDNTDGLTVQCLAGTLFLFLACLEWIKRFNEKLACSVQLFRRHRTWLMA